MKITRIFSYEVRRIMYIWPWTIRSIDFDSSWKDISIITWHYWVFFLERICRIYLIIYMPNFRSKWALYFMLFNAHPLVPFFTIQHHVQHLIHAPNQGKTSSLLRRYIGTIYYGLHFKKNLFKIDFTLCSIHIVIHHSIDHLGIESKCKKTI